MRYFHPLSKLTAVIALLPVIMFCTSLTAAGLGLAAAVVGLTITRGGRYGAKALFLSLGAAVLIALTNPLISHRGATPLLFINGRAYTLEAMLFGFDLGLSAAAVIALLTLLQDMTRREELLALMGRFSPKLALAVSMSLGFVPKIRRKTADISSAQLTSGLLRGESCTDRVVSSGRVFMAAAAWSAEAAAETAQVMNSRCYGMARLSKSSAAKPKARDKAICAASLLLMAVTAALYAKGGRQWFYPRLNTEDWAVSALFAVSFAAQCLLPVFMAAFIKKLGGKMR